MQTEPAPPEALSTAPTTTTTTTTSNNNNNNPRRPPAHASVSLRHDTSSTSANVVSRQSTKLKSPPSPASDKANPPSSTSPNLLSNKHSSGESSDAGKWFEATNNRANNNSSFVDNDPPLLLYNSSSSSTPPERMYPAIPHRPGVTRLPTDGSSNGDFRSVIDDLTIANKKLRQKLRRYERVHDAHMQQDKLFEVKFHGLPDHKKRELEETLRKFASGLDGESSNSPEMPMTYVPMLSKEATGSSTSRFAESGYVSMSASGQHSSAVSNQTSNPNIDNSRQSKSAYNRQQQSIQSYLHDIPRGLLGEDSAHMSDKSRKKLVVRRLEQIFAGKRSTPDNHPQPLQQEEVAQSAATADRREREATGLDSLPEGLREALIMPNNDDEDDVGAPAEALSLNPAIQHVNQQDFAGSASPNQRPTRPLDLDPHRAQVPINNMNYFKHLGFSPPDMITGIAQQDDHGWLYLNLLINMAQLHTLNVTPDFVKDALTEYSSKLELSHDGRRIRWRGGLDVSKDSSDSSPEHDESLATYAKKVPGSRSPLKRIQADTSCESSESHIGSENQAKRQARVDREAQMNRFAYKPLFFRRESSEDGVDYYGYTPEPSSNSNSADQAEQKGDSSGLDSSTLQQPAPTKKRRDDGPMIFYRKARFCTDLTGDRPGASITNPEAYNVVTSQPIGASPSRGHSSNRHQAGELRFFLNDCMDIDAPRDGVNTPSSSGYMGFSPNSLENNNGTDAPNVMDFEASGLGGVEPDDNFSVQVQRLQVPTVSTQAPHQRAKAYPKKIRELLKERSESNKQQRGRMHHSIKQEITGIARKDLPSSVLPEASYLTFDSPSDDDSDDTDVSSEAEPLHSDNGGPNPALNVPVRPIRGNYEVEQSEESDSESSYSEESDESIDLLATARQQNPAMINAYEREYDAAIADRLVEEIAAGSSAATAGGGSGFNTPAERLTEHAEIAQKKRRSPSGDSSALNPSMKRTRTSESIMALSRTGSKGSKNQRTK